MVIQTWKEDKLLVFSFQSQIFGSQEVKLFVEEIMM